MPLSISAKHYVIGPADVYNRAVGVNTPWASKGATLDDCVMRVMLGWFAPDNISGVKTVPMGLDVLRRLGVEFEFTLPDFVANLGDVVPGARTTAEVHADAGGTPFSSTLSAATAVGATTIPATAVDNLAVGDHIRIGTAPELIEYRQVTAIATLNVSFRDPLIAAHASGAAAVETTGDYRTLYESSLYTRMPDSAYLEWALVMPSGNGYHELRIPRGLSVSDSLEVTVGDNGLAGVRVRVRARANPDDLQESPFKLFIAEN